MIPVAWLAFAAIATGSTPLTGLIEPSKLSSPITQYDANWVVGINSVEAKIPTAIGKS
jgi:hypothetical protein